MNEWDQTGWDLRVWNAKRRIPTTASQNTLPEWDEWIIAADAELKRLREEIKEVTEKWHQAINSRR